MIVQALFRIFSYAHALIVLFHRYHGAIAAPSIEVHCVRMLQSADKLEDDILGILGRDY